MTAKKRPGGAKKEDLSTRSMVLSGAGGFASVGPGRKKRWNYRGPSAVVLLVLVVLTIWTLSPFLVSMVVSLQTRGEVFANPSFFPRNPSFDSYRTVFDTPTFWSSLTNSTIVGLGTTVLTIVIAVPAAYAFARFNFRGRALLLLFTLLPRLVPNLALMVPLYRLAVETGALDKIVTLIFVYTGMILPLAVFLLVGFYQKLPAELEEAASIDGASLWQRIRYLILPLSIPALITIGVLAFREAWNEFTIVLVLITSVENRTLPYELYSYQGTEGIIDYPAQAALAILTIVPFILVYMRLEKYVVQGITSGSGK
jgi:ABC-type glycerol-3-phosphate transport system permease component